MCPICLPNVDGFLDLEAHHGGGIGGGSGKDARGARRVLLRRRRVGASDLAGSGGAIYARFSARREVLGNRN